MKSTKLSMFVLLGVLCLSLAACGGGGEESTPVADQPAPPPPTGGNGGNGGEGNVDPFTAPAAPTAGEETSDRDEIVALVYDESYRTPAGFYKDVHDGAVVHHLLDDTNSFERCDEGADDFLNLAALYLETITDSYSFVGSTVDREFFYEVEVSIADGEGVAKTLYVRSYKCYAVNRDGVDVQLVGTDTDNTYGGKLLMTVAFDTLEDKRALIDNAVVQFSQYEFNLTYPDTTVISVDTINDEPAVDVTHEITFAQVISSTESCDMIEVVKLSNRVNKVNLDTIGEITRLYEVVDTFGADLVDGVRVPVDSCGS